MTNRRITVETIDPGIEKLIITGMIIDTKFLGELVHTAKREYFKGTYTGIVAEWCRDYYLDHKSAPRRVINDIFTVKKDTEVYDEEDQAVMNSIGTFLNKISDEYSGTFNTEYMLRKAFPYFQNNSLTYRLDKAQRLVSVGDTEAALKLLRDTGKEVFEESKRAVTFPNLEELDKIYTADRESIMHFTGDLGRYMGSLRRGKFISFLGPTKRGKSHWLVECAFQAVFSGLKVYFFSLELTKEEIQELFLMRFTNKEINEGDPTRNSYTIPVFDCLTNQTGECDMDICLSPDSNVFNEESGQVMEYDRGIIHRPCCECLKREDLRENYVQTSWFLTVEQDTLKHMDLYTFWEDFTRQQGAGSLKIKAYPIGTATFEDVENDLDKEEAHNGWIADVVVVDSLDNFKANKKVAEKRHQLSEIWQEGSRVTKSRNVLTFTATQGNRQSFNKDRLEATDVAEDFSKAMVLDGLIAINERGHTTKDKTMKDKYWKRQQLEWLLHRYKAIIPGQQCMILQNFDLGQTVLDSKICMYQPLKGGS